MPSPIHQFGFGRAVGGVRLVVSHCQRGKRNHVKLTIPIDGQRKDWHEHVDDKNVSRLAGELISLYANLAGLL